jgi:hypothetical protein
MAIAQELFLSDQEEAIKSNVAANSILKIRGNSVNDMLEVFTRRIIEVAKSKKNDIKIENILILTTSMDSINEIHNKFNEKKHQKISSQIKIVTFSGLIDEFLLVYHPTWKILKESKIKEIQKSLDDQKEIISYDKLKKSIQQISAISSNRIQSMSNFESLLRYGLNKERCLLLKKIVGDFLYIPYGQFIEEASKFPELIKMMNKYKFISIANFHNLRENEAEFLSKVGIGKHITIIGDKSPTAKYKQFEKNWKFISNSYKKNKITEIELTKVNNNYSKEPADEYIDLNKLINVNLKSALTCNKINPNSATDITKTVLQVFNNPNNDLALIQLLTIIPECDEKFINKFCDIVSNEDISVFEFINKYQDSFTDKTKQKLLPISGYLKNLEKKLDKTSGNSIMIHLMSFCKTLGIELYKSEKMKEEFGDIHLQFYHFSSRSKSSKNLLDYYIKNNSLKKLPNNNQMVNMNKNGIQISNNGSSLFNTNLNINVPLTFNVNSSKMSEMKFVQQPPVLRRSGSIKYKPRPSSWHAGIILNSAARKIK